MTALSVIGQSVPKTDGVAKVTGRTAYAADMIQPGMLTGRMLCSPHAHARILSIDTSAAEQMKGVYAVATNADATTNRIGQFLEDRYVLAHERVRYVGEPVAAVAATDDETAAEALDRIVVEYEPLPAIFDPKEAMKPGAPIFHPDLATYKDNGPSRRSGNVRNEVRVKRGDVEKAFAECDVIVEDEFRTQYAHQGYIEPRACVASVDGSGHITIWTTTKAPFRVRQSVVQGLNLPMSKVRIIVPAMGGDFGGKGSASIEPIAAILARKSGRPVRIAVTREEEMAGNPRRHASTSHVKVGFTKDGTFHALQGEVYYDAGAYSGGIRGLAHTVGNFMGPYRVGSVDIVGYSVYTNNVPGGQVRAPGAPQTFFAIEQVVDEAARRLNLDPFELRRRIALREGDMSPGGHHIVKNLNVADTLNHCEEAARGFRRGPNRGIGVACGNWHLEAELGTASSASLKCNEDGTVVLSTGLTDNGAGQYTLMSQIVAEVLGIAPTDVNIIAADTDHTPYESGTGGSNTTYRVGNTIKQAAEHARQQILHLAAEKLEANVEDLELANRKVYVRGAPDRSVGLGAIATAALTSRGGPIIGTNASERERWLDALGKAEGVIDAPAVVAAAVELEVDPATGQITVLNYVAAQDVGHALNPRLVEGQIEGSVSNGLGYALTEEFHVDDKGNTRNPSFLDYKMQTAVDTPRILPVMVEEQSDFGPYGAKGVGEPSVTVVAAAIANAVRDAIGVRVRECPVTPERVRRALDEAAKR